MQTVNAAQFLDMVKAQERGGAKSARPSKQQALQQSVLQQNQLRLSSNMTSAVSLQTAGALGAPQSSTNQSAGTVLQQNAANRLGAGASQPPKPTFRPEINKKSSKLASQRQQAPLFSNERYQKTLEERNQKLEALKRRREAELAQKEQEEQEEIAKRQLHKTTQKVDVNDFKRAYDEKMEQLHRKKQAKQENLTREAQKANTYAPAINKYSRKIAEAGGIAKVR